MAVCEEEELDVVRHDDLAVIKAVVGAVVELGAPQRRLSGSSG